MKFNLLILVMLACTGLVYAQSAPVKDKPAAKPKTADELAYEALFAPIKLRRDSMMRLYSKFSPEEKKGSAKLTELNVIAKQLAEQGKVINEQFLRDHPESLHALKVIREIDGGGVIVNADIEEPLFMKLDQSVRNSPEGKAFAARLEKSKSLAIGKMAPMFEQPDTNGKMVSLKSFAGQYVLVDFWASWCAPCRAENPNVLKAYNAYKSKNFTVLGVSMDGATARAAWLKAIKDDAMPWMQISELAGWNNNAADLYDVHAIPQNYLIDPSGKIVAKNIRGQQLHETLKRLLGN